MGQMILSKKRKEEKKQKQVMAKESRLGVPKGERGGSGMDGHFGVFRMQTFIFGVDGRWDHGVQHRKMCVIGSLRCTAELDETLSIDYTLIIKKEIKAKKNTYLS